VTHSALPKTTLSPTTQILIVEDEYVLAANLQENLETLGYDVLDIASSATDAINQAAALHPDLVLMDIRLQGTMDGIQAAEQIWNQLQIPVIYLTGHSDTSTLERAKVTFPFGYLLKPVKEKELYMAIETALNHYEREQLLATILKGIDDGMIVVNNQGRILFLNHAAERLTGWQQTEARNRELPEVFNLIYEDTHLPIGNIAAIAIHQDTIVFLNEPMLLITKAGTALPITESVAPIQNQKGMVTGAVLIFRDDTQRRLRRERNQTMEQVQLLRRQQEELEELNLLKDDFLSTVSHELRTPLSNIRMAIQMLEVVLNQHEADHAAIEPASHRMRRYIEILRDQCDQELSLVNDLLELQQFQAGVYPVEWVSISLNEWILDRIETFQERACSRDQRLRAIVTPDLPVLISDLSILTRTLVELLANACKYTPPGGEITVTVQAQSENRIQIIVSNTGVEIAKDELTRIFDKFYRIPTSDRWQQGGTGLGLALIKKSIAYLNGSVWAESSAMQTQFIVELPLSSPSAALESTSKSD
jgi:PAS domain S-box-containing protein